jgi:hypothetical protein
MAVSQAANLVEKAVGHLGVASTEPVLATSEVIPSRAMRALEGEGRGLSHLEVAARGGGCGAS